MIFLVMSFLTRFGTNFLYLCIDSFLHGTYKPMDSLILLNIIDEGFVWKEHVSSACKKIGTWCCNKMC